jgi:hypothetical protein
MQTSERRLVNQLMQNQKQALHELRAALLIGDPHEGNSKSLLRFI